jgi:DNA-binding transcriptional regulator YiaG
MTAPATIADRAKQLVVKLKLREHPEPRQLTEIRSIYGLTQTEAGRLCFSSLRTWQGWEAGDRKMHQAIWQWFLHELAARCPVKTIAEVRNG